MRIALFALLNDCRLTVHRRLTSNVVCAMWDRPRCQFCNGSFPLTSAQLQQNTNKLVQSIVYQNAVPLQVLQRFKSSKSGKGRKRPPVEDEDDDDAERVSAADEEQSTKIASVYVPSLRVDTLLKAAFGLARNKSETAFYQSRVYKNGKVIQKKNSTVEIKDEVDLVRGFNAQNDRFIDVMRLEIVDIEVPQGADNIMIKLHRYKQLTIENYPDQPWSGSSDD